MMNNYLNQMYPYAMDNYYQNYYNQNNPNNSNISSNITNEGYKGFIRGNFFDSLYDPYKKYTPIEPVISNEKEELLEQVQVYNFALTDLNLYLDNNPNDMNAINLYNNYLTYYKKAIQQYEEKYGPLTSDNVNKENNWQWDNNPWPWEVQ